MKVLLSAFKKVFFNRGFLRILKKFREISLTAVLEREHKLSVSVGASPASYPVPANEDSLKVH